MLPLLDCDDEEELKLTCDTDEPLSGTVLEKRKYLSLSLNLDTRFFKKGGSSPEPKCAEYFRISKEYRIEKRLGIGSYSQVYAATNKNTGVKYAIKKGKGQSNTIRIKQEYEILKNLNHPNIPKVYDLKVDERTGTSYLVMELGEGVSIDEYIIEHGLPTQKETLEITKQLCLTVQYLHESGICHRDIKPQNILIDSCLNIKLIDFNISKVVKKMDDVGNLSRLGFSFKLMTQIGSPMFSAPEIYSADGYTEKIDVWGIGIVLLHLILKNCDMPTNFEELDDCKKIDSMYMGFLMKCLSYNPDLRYTTKECLDDPLFDDFNVE